MTRRLVGALLLLSAFGCSGLEGVAPEPQAGVAGSWRIGAPDNGDEVVAEGCDGDALGGASGAAFDTFARSCRAEQVVVTQSGEAFDMADSVVRCTEAGASDELLGTLTDGGGTVAGDRIEGSAILTTAGPDGRSERMEFTGTLSGDAVTLEEVRREALPSASPSATPTGSCGWSPALTYPVTITR